MYPYAPEELNSIWGNKVVKWQKSLVMRIVNLVKNQIGTFS